VHGIGQMIFLYLPVQSISVFATFSNAFGVRTIELVVMIVSFAATYCSENTLEKLLSKYRRITPPQRFRIIEVIILFSLQAIAPLQHISTDMA